VEAPGESAGCHRKERFCIFYVEAMGQRRTSGMSDNDCGRVFALLSAYPDQELAQASCEELEHHLRDCPECIQFVRSLKRRTQLCPQPGNCAPAPKMDADAMAALRRAYERMLARRRNSQGIPSQG
jgi:anti-sigma factor RsiW